MHDFYITRLQECTIILYALALLFYFIDFMHANHKANRIAFWLLSFVWILQSSFLILYMMEKKRFPILTMLEGLYFYTWLLISLSLLMNRLVKIDFFVFFTNVVGFIIMANHTFAPFQASSDPASEQVVSELLILHITASILAYTFFSFSFSFSLLYELQFYLLKKKKWGKRLIRIADLSKLEHLSYLLNVIGVPLLIIGLILGVQWAFLQLPQFHWYDPKIIGSFLMVVAYSRILYLRANTRLNGRQLAYWNGICFFIMWINFFLIGSFSTFHY